MKETIYRCDRCGQLITDTRHKLNAQDEKGNATKYGALLENIDLCEDCMASTSLAILDLIGDSNTTKDGEDPQRQQEEQLDTEDQPKPQTYKCSEAIKTCKYAVKVGAVMCCDYINIAGHRRGCEPERCNKYEKVIRKRGPKPREGGK